ncbi:hypothetical protein [Pseudomonas fluorescens]|uniref:YD repeat-containing protein n=1 Tax=Pseudomonas fluorescens TaxID=294 RepID=A0A5E7FVV8_PSEFL|nr:hypothetical protein [Pseudomonas fluorescens]VVO42742.1 hypothetical protein PS710_06082 [Pseudomonas fluorescens]
MGNPAEETSYDWLEEEPLLLRQSFEYDAWGIAFRTTGPDGSVSNLLWSPFGENGPIEYRWLETGGPQTTIMISNLTGGEYNDFAKVKRFERLGAQPLIDLCRQQPEQPVAEHLRRLLRTNGLPTVGAAEYCFDGKGNCVQQKELFDTQERKTAYTYDEWSRVKATTLADDTVVGRLFAEQSSNEQVTRLNVKPANVALPEVTVGHQKFDSLLRLTEVSIGSSATPRIEQYRYNGSGMQPSQRITPLATFDYDYKPELTHHPIAIKSGKDQTATYTYDTKTGGLKKASNSQGHSDYRYTDSGQLAYESWTDTDGTLVETHYVSSLLGRQISRSHTKGLETCYTYDKEDQHADKHRFGITECTDFICGNIDCCIAGTRGRDVAEEHQIGSRRILRNVRRIHQVNGDFILGFPVWISGDRSDQLATGWQGGIVQEVVDKR